MIPKYYQGESVKGQVRASAARSFAEVVDALRICPVLGLTREEFLALDKKQRNEVKKVPFFVAATFKAATSDRTYAQAVSCNLVFLDIDEMPDGTCPAAPFARNPESLALALDGLNYAAYHTASSTPVKPRMRVVVDADEIPVADYPRAVGTIAKRLGLPSVTSESRVAVQPMFLPTMFRDSADSDHPLISYRLDAGSFRVDSLEHDEKAEYGQPRTKEEFGQDALDFLRAPIPEISLAVAKEALSALDPDCPYPEWFAVAAALRHQFSPHKECQAYEIFDSWSATGSKYADSAETRAKWDSARPTPIGRLPVTIRSLLRQAVLCGWDDKRVKESSFSGVVRWLEEVASATELLEHGVKKILSAPLLSSVQEDILIHQICAQAKKRFAYTISSSAIRKDLSKLKAEIKGQSKPPEEIKNPNWAKGVCYIASAGDFYRRHTGEKYKSEAMNACYGRWLLPTEAYLKECGLPVTAATLSKPVVNPTDYALNHLKIVTVYDYAYDPSQPTEMFFVKDGRRFVNVYSPTYPEKDANGATEAGELFMSHLENLIGEKDNRTTLVDFLAYMVQFPGRKIRWAPLIQGVEGCGKTYISEAMKAVLGKEHVATISGSSIKSGYNEWSFGHQLVVLEEVRVAGSGRHEIMNALKPLITNDTVSINEKFRNQREAANTSNYILFSNNHDALALTPGDRRYFVLKSPLQDKAQVLALGEKYFRPLYKMLTDRPGALRAWLDDWLISESFSPNGHAPRTSYVAEMVSDSASDLTASVRRLLLEADFPLIQYDIVSLKTLMDVVNLEEGIHRVTHQQLAQILREEGFRKLGRHLLGSERHYLWIRSGVDEKTAVAVAADRQKREMKNLCMELLF